MSKVEKAIFSFDIVILFYVSLQVLCMGTGSVYVDNAKEPHDVVILKHFTEKNRAVVVDLKTRKRKTGK